MNIEELELAIGIAHRARISLFVSGPNGLGKSASAIHYAANSFHFVKKDGTATIPYGYIDLRCASMESSELRGLPSKNVEDGTVEYLPPDELPRGEWINSEGEVYGEVGSDKPKDKGGITWALHKGILVLEEVNRAEDDIHQALFQLVYDFQIGKWKMPTGWSIVATGNPSGGNFIVNQFMHEPAFKDRFVHVNVAIDDEYVKGWVKYITDLPIDNGITGKIAQFCSASMEHLSAESESADTEEIVVTPSPRSWEMVAKIERAYIEFTKEYDGESKISKNVHYQLISGIIGSDLAAHYMEFSINVTPKQIVDGFFNHKDVVVALERNQLQALSWNVNAYANKITDMKDSQADNLIAFGKFILLEASATDGDNRDLAIGYFDTLLQKEQKEEIRELSFTNKSMAKLMARTNNDGYLFSKIKKDPQLDNLLHDGHRGILSHEESV